MPSGQTLQQRWSARPKSPDTELKKFFWSSVKQNGILDRLIKQREILHQRGPFSMEQNPAAATLWRMWVDTKRRIVSFHEEKDCQLLEFRSHEMFLSCVDQYACKQYRYQ